MIEIRVIINRDRTNLSGPFEVDMTFYCRNKSDAHEYFEKAMTAFEMAPGAELGE